MAGFTLYTYSRCDRPASEPRWQNDGTGNDFFDSAEATKAALTDLKNEVLAAPEETWVPMQIETVEILPLTNANLVTLLNEGVGALIKSHEVVETVS